VNLTHALRLPYNYRGYLTGRETFVSAKAAQKLAMLAVLGVCLTVCCYLHAQVPPWDEFGPPYVFYGWAEFVLVLVAFAFARRQLTPRQERIACLLVLLFALTMRLPFLARPTLRSTDPFRFLWDGRIQRAGINPYLYPPNDEAVKRYRTDYWKWINNKSVRTIYPPTSQLVFRLAAVIVPGSTRGLKAIFTLFDLGTLLALFGALSSLRRPASLALLFGWHPLPITEYAGSGHQDSIGIFFLALALWAGLALYRQRGAVWTAVALALSTLAKGYSLLFVPFLSRYRRFRPLPFAAWYFATIALLCLPYAGAGRNFFSGMGDYSAHWERNSSLFAVLQVLCRPFTEDPGALARFVALGLIVVFTTLMALRPLRSTEEPQRSLELVRRMFYVMAFFLLVTPLDYPWYFCWLLPFLVIYPHVGGLLLTAVVPMVYLFQRETPESTWLRLAEYTPVYALFLLQLVVTTEEGIGSHEGQCAQRGAV